MAEQRALLPVPPNCGAAIGSGQRQSVHLGFNGDLCEPITGHYLLGNGYRAYNPVLMRFNSPDSLSPFSDGGLNAYAYCLGDPVNHVDRDGHIPAFLNVHNFLKVVSGTALVASGGAVIAGIAVKEKNLKTGLMAVAGVLLTAGTVGALKTWHRTARLADTAPSSLSPPSYEMALRHPPSYETALLSPPSYSVAISRQTQSARQVADIRRSSGMAETAL